MTEKFKEHVEAAGRGERDHWKSDKDGRLAFILLCDQFPRNIYRKTEQAFAFDHLALAASKEAVSNEALFDQYKNFEVLCGHAIDAFRRCQRR